MANLQKRQKGLKAARLLAVLAFIALALPASAADNDYAEIFYGGDGTTFSLYMPSIEDHGSYVSGWVRGILGDALSSQLANAIGLSTEPAYSMFQYDASMERRQVRTLSLHLNSADGLLLYEENPAANTEWESCAPDTVIEAVWDALTTCAKIMRELKAQ